MIYSSEVGPMVLCRVEKKNDGMRVDLLKSRRASNENTPHVTAMRGFISEANGLLNVNKADLNTAKIEYAPKSKLILFCIKRPSSEIDLVDKQPMLYWIPLASEHREMMLEIISEEVGGSISESFILRMMIPRLERCYHMHF